MCQEKKFLKELAEKRKNRGHWGNSQTDHMHIKFAILRPRVDDP